MFSFICSMNLYLLKLDTAAELLHDFTVFWTQMLRSDPYL